MDEDDDEEEEEEERGTGTLELEHRLDEEDEDGGHTGKEELELEHLELARASEKPKDSRATAASDAKFIGLMFVYPRILLPSLFLPYA